MAHLPPEEQAATLEDVLGVGVMGQERVDVREDPFSVAREESEEFLVTIQAPWILGRARSRGVVRFDHERPGPWERLGIRFPSPGNRTL
jgi:hypothetical protein